MLMECLAAGRGISLPGTSTGGAKLVARVVGAYAAVRKQFGVPIGKFEGIEEPLARIGGYTYLMEAARRYTCGALDAGAKPPVITAMAKLNFTELYRKIINDGMDVLGGAAISRGPRNLLAHGYIGAPISITVEGANILTRSLIVFGQGANRCHPWVLEEIQAVADEDLARFDRAFFKHIGFTTSNGFRSLLLGLSAGRLGRPALGGPLQEYLGQLTRMSAAFTFLSDLVMATLGGELKRKEMISGRMADALGWMYLCSATLKRYMNDGHPEEDEAIARWSCEYGLFQIQTALDGVFSNFPVAWVKGFRPIIFPLGARLKAPSDRLTREVARQLTEGRAGRERLTADIFVPSADEPGLGQLEDALRKVVSAYPLEKKIKTALKDRRLKRADRPVLLKQAQDMGILTEEEVSFLQEVDAARNEAIQVDAFPAEFFGFDEGKEDPVRAQA
jgi:acyl-CoA dehydrogenase